MRWLRIALESIEAQERLQNSPLPVSSPASFLLRSALAADFKHQS
jgi:hypothetical protein